VAKLPWRRAETVPSLERRPGAVDSAPGAQTCSSLRRVLERILKLEKPEILDLGPLCGASAVYLASRGARVSVEEFQPPPPTPPRDPAVSSDKQPPKLPIKIEQDAGRFDLVLVGEQFDFVPPDRISDFGAELRRLLAGGGYVLLFARNSDAKGDPAARRPGRFRIIADDRLLHEDSGGSNRKRWVHPTREIERALAPLLIQGIHLQRNQLREFLAQNKPG
jgi:hypothetical protein